MNIVTVKEDYVGTWIVNPDSGEVLGVVESHKHKPRVAPFDKYVGEDVKHPSECLTEDSLIASLSVIDAYVKDSKPKVNSELILESILTGNLSKSEASVLAFVAKNLSGWNYYITTVNDLSVGSGVDKTNISKAVGKLTDNLLRVVIRDKPSKGCIVLKINPVIAWKGDITYRESSINNWY